MSLQDLGYPPDREDNSGIIQSFDGPTSPKSKQELESLSPEEIVKYLATWTPPEETFAEASPDGLGREFSAVVTEKPDVFSKLPDLLYTSKLRPVYYVYLLYGLREAIKANKCFDWDQVLQLGNKLIRANPSHFPRPSKHEMGLREFKDNLIGLIGNGLVSQNCPIPFDLRDKVWEIIEFCTNDPEPTLRYEKKYGGQPFDPASLSINTVRGEAMHSVIKYALWCSKNLYKVNKRKVNKLVPEAQLVLDKHLNLKNEPTQTIRSVYGWYLPNLFYLNKEWVKKNLNKIFPKSKQNTNFRYSAWEAYLSNSVYYDLFPYIEKEYLTSIPFLHEPQERKYRGVDVNERLPQHFAIAYIDGIAKEEFIRTFFRKAPPKAKGEILSFIGRAVLKDENLKPTNSKEKARLARIKKLILWRATDPSATDSEELVELGWWFPRSPFGKKFNIRILLEVLKKTNGITDYDHEVVETLENYAEEFPLETASTLELIIQGTIENWKIGHHSESIKNSLSKIKASKSKLAKEKALKLVHLLGEKGFMQFRDLA